MGGLKMQKKHVPLVAIVGAASIAALSLRAQSAIAERGYHRQLDLAASEGFDVKAFDERADVAPETIVPVDSYLVHLLQQVPSDNWFQMHGGAEPYQ